ncbi:MAG: hypothetical protein EA361_04330 [Bacteroidetes bacterium]|nr:MAG: hypothetical protein EA361_04330 [Bacteroidota bacterium]
MKKLIALSILLSLSLSLDLYSQDSRALRAARMSFSSAERNFKNSSFEEAAREYAIVINTIPASTDSRKHLEMRLESLIKLVDIHFYHHVNVSKACEYVQQYSTNMNVVRNQGTLRASTLLTYQRVEQEFASEHEPKCRAYKGIDSDMDRFKQKFEEEFE